MIKIEKKNIKNKGFYYLSEQVNIGGKFKKIQVYIGKTIPNNLGYYLDNLKDKEVSLVKQNIVKIFDLEKSLDLIFYQEIEKVRINFKYYFSALSENKERIFWRDFAIKFIFESNSIEGSRLSQNEIENIVKDKYVKKTIDRKEILEVENSIKAFDVIRGGQFKLNQNNLKKLHKTIVDGLGIPFGYKKEEIIVNNKKTCLPENVKKEMTGLINWWSHNRTTKKNKFILAIKFHQRFEKIHPFSDGNGRVGRLILIWMLINSGYGVILFKNKNRQKYFSALDFADEGGDNKLYIFAVETYKKTLKNLFIKENH